MNLSRFYQSNLIDWWIDCRTERFAVTLILAALICVWGWATSFPPSINLHNTSGTEGRVGSTGPRRKVPIRRRTIRREDRSERPRHRRRRRRRSRGAARARRRASTPVACREGLGWPVPAAAAARTAWSSNDDSHHQTLVLLVRRNTTPAQVKFQQLRRILEQPKSLVSKSRVHPLSFIVEPRSVLLPRYIIIIYIEKKKKENRGFFSFFVLVSVFCSFLYTYCFSFPLTSFLFQTCLSPPSWIKKEAKKSTYKYPRGPKKVYCFSLLHHSLYYYLFFFFRLSPAEFCLRKNFVQSK